MFKVKELLRGEFKIRTQVYGLAIQLISNNINVKLNVVILILLAIFSFEVLPMTRCFSKKDLWIYF